nr:hypothetical protein [Lacrimispora sp.]
MWEKQFRSDKSMLYRRKYKCPKCGNYTLLLIHDESCECAEGCDDSDINIELVKNNDDYNGYFTSEEIKENFYTDFEAIEELLSQCIIKEDPIAISVKQKEKIEEYSKRSDIIDKNLDNATANYFNYFEINKVDEFKPYNYLITLIEDMHFFLNLICKDVNLFERTVSNKFIHNEYMYSGRFFANNAIDHLFLANERMYVILGILYNFDFKDDLSQNRTFKIKNAIKKNENYLNQFASLINKLNGNVLYKELEEIRNSNEHDLSYMSKKVVETKRSEMLDGDQVDKEFYLPKIDNITLCMDILYSILEKIVQIVDNYRFYNMQSFPMHEIFLKQKINLKLKSFDLKYYEGLERYNKSLEDNIICFNGDLMITDTYFRLDEVLHCIRDIYNHANGSQDISLVNFNNYIEIDYIIYSAITRLYTCYDKISRYLSSHYTEFECIKYFDDFSKLKSNNTIYKKIDIILKNDAYKTLKELRNNIYHNLRSGIIFGKCGENYHNMVLTQLILENEMLLFNLLEVIKPLKKIRLAETRHVIVGVS